MTAKKSEVIEGTFTANIGIFPHGSTVWTVIGTVELPYKVRVYMQPAPETTDDNLNIEGENK